MDEEFSYSSGLPELTRRNVLRYAATLLTGSFLSKGSLFAQGQPTKIEQPNTGTAGALWHDLLQKRNAQPGAGIPLLWLGGDPGQSQVQLLAGAIDVGFFGPIGGVETALRGHDVAIFAPGLINHGSWLVKGNSSFRSPQDLKGKRIATQPETTETYRQARLAASLIGLDLKHDFEFIFGPPTANLALFERGDVDAVITIEPVSTRLIAGGAREIAKVRDQWRQGTNSSRPLFLGGQGTRREWFDQNRGVVSKLSKFYLSANQEIQARPQILADLHQEMGIPSTDRAAIELLVKRLPEIYQSEWSPLVISDANKVIDIAVRNGILRGKSPRPIIEVV